MRHFPFDTTTGSDRLPRIGAMVVVGTLVIALGIPLSAAGKAEKVTICHAAGQEGTDQHVTLNLAYPAVFGNGGHFNEDGSTKAGHEGDYMGPCHEDTTTTIGATVPESVPETTVTTEASTTTSTSSVPEEPSSEESVPTTQAPTTTTTSSVPETTVTTEASTTTSTSSVPEEPPAEESVPTTEATTTTSTSVPSREGSDKEVLPASQAATTTTTVGIAATTETSRNDKASPTSVAGEQNGSLRGVEEGPTTDTVGSESLPFTGIESHLVIQAAALLAIGILLVFVAGTVETSTGAHVSATGRLRLGLHRGRHESTSRS